MREYYEEIDYTSSPMYVDIMARKMRQMLKLTAISMGIKLPNAKSAVKTAQELGREVYGLLHKWVDKPGVPTYDKFVRKFVSEYARIHEEAGLR